MMFIGPFDLIHLVLGTFEMVGDANFGDSQDVVYCIDIPFNI